MKRMDEREGRKKMAATWLFSKERGQKERSRPAFSLPARGKRKKM